MNSKVAYAAMYAFLEAEYELTKSDEIGALLGSMSLLPDGLPADPAVAEQWKNACVKAEGGFVEVGMKLK